MDRRTIFIAIVSFLLGALLTKSGIVPIHWGFPHLLSGDGLIIIGLIGGFLYLYSRNKELEARLNRVDPSSGT